MTIWSASHDTPRDNRRYAGNLSFPFVHLWPDGEVWRFDDRKDVDVFAHYARAHLDTATFGHTELDEATPVLDWNSLKAFHTTFTRYTPGGDPLGRSEAIWVSVRSDGVWKLKLRIGAVRIT